jgi:hypothetical protein
MVRAESQMMNRDRNIYYDTDNIHEHQQETIRVCDNCGGAFKIDSAAQGRKSHPGRTYPAEHLRILSQTGLPVV